MIFVSHSSLDKAVVEALIELLKNSLEINPDVIRCTSVDGYRLPGGTDTDDDLRRELLESDCFIGLLTRHSFNSPYVLFELGARWGADRHLVPLVAAGFQPSDLRGPLTGINALSCGSASQLHQLVDEIAQLLDVNKRAPAKYQQYIERLNRASESAIHGLQYTVTKESQEISLMTEVGKALKRVFSAFLGRVVHRNDSREIKPTSG